MNKVELLDLEATYFSKNRVATFSSFSIFEKVAPIFNYDWIINFNISFGTKFSDLAKFYLLCREKGFIFLVTVDFLFLKNNKSILNKICRYSDFIRFTSFDYPSFPKKFYLSKKINKKSFILYSYSFDFFRLKRTNVIGYKNILEPSRLNIMSCSCNGIFISDSGIIYPNCKSFNRDNCFHDFNINSKNIFFFMNLYFSHKGRLKYFSNIISDKDCNCDYLFNKNKNENFIQYLKRSK